MITGNEKAKNCFSGFYYAGHFGIDATHRSEERGMFNFLSLSYISKLLFYCLWEGSCKCSLKVLGNVQTLQVISLRG